MIEYFKVLPIMNFLKEILNHKKKELKEKKKICSFASLKERVENRKGEGRNFVKAILQPKIGDVAIIAEIKLASPSSGKPPHQIWCGGKIGKTTEVEKRAKIYEKSSADAISIVTDKKFFQGELQFIPRVKAAVSLPVLAKDFIITPYQIYELKLFGADSILFIAKILSLPQLKKFVAIAKKLKIEPIIEVNNEQELKRAIKTDARCIAVNARNLDTFNIDLKNACRLLKLIPKKFIPIAFSGIKNRKDVEPYIDAGAKAVLVGTTLMKINPHAKTFGAEVKETILKLKGIT